jgi:hypothetical protein
MNCRFITSGPAVNAFNPDCSVNAHHWHAHWRGNPRERYGTCNRGIHKPLMVQSFGGLNGGKWGQQPVHTVRVA